MKFNEKEIQDGETSNKSEIILETMETVETQNKVDLDLEFKKTPTSCMAIEIPEI